MEPVLLTVRKRENLPENWPKEFVSHCLSEWLDPWGDPPDQIGDALDYVFSSDHGRGGFLLLAGAADSLVGALVMLDTGMGGFIPRFHLVYVAVDPAWRGHGLGARLVRAGLEAAGEPASLHVDADNPSRRLYERLGFSVKYLEMRTSSHT